MTETICPYCGVGCSLELHVQDNRIVKVTSAADHDITLGNLCVKGRFGFLVHLTRPGGGLPPGEARLRRLGPLRARGSSAYGSASCTSPLPTTWSTRPGGGG